jgi:hypothetical protein
MVGVVDLGTTHKVEAAVAAPGALIDSLRRHGLLVIRVRDGEPFSTVASLVLSLVDSDDPVK